MNTPDVQTIFAEALGFTSVAERLSYLDRACAGNNMLRRDVESLLAAHEQARYFMRKTPPVSDFMVERAGAMIGRYKLLEKLGEGGFGVVWMAEQVEPLRRCVALKVIKLGMDTREVVARFEAERQALALMDHPNIAKVLEAGATGAGRPYFVMELVRGIPITDYCDQKSLSTVERLQLFVQVCHAVQHAHQKGIIHRDLKPSNVMITVHDGEPVPKVIDFGVAKALGQKLTDKTLFTGYAQMLGTPAYMSPEQAELRGLEIDVRSDIYSLGVLLYELLTGVTPFEKETLAKAALDEVRRLIRETDPPKPSTRLRALGEKLTEIAQRRHVEPSVLPRLVQGDLDWIVMKCLEKDRTRRYETAIGLLEDLERHLMHKPVSAGAPGPFYRAKKFVRRHQNVAGTTGVLTAALIVGMALARNVTLALALGLLMSLAAFAKVRRERDRAQAAEAKAQAKERQAQTEATRSAHIARFLQEMLKGVEPAVAMGRDTTLLREILDKTADRISRELQGEPAVEGSLRNTLGQVYWALADPRKSAEMHREALRIRRQLLGNNHPDVAESLLACGLALHETRDGEDEAKQLLAEALQLNRLLFGDEHPRVAEVLSAQGRMALHTDSNIAEPLLTQALAMQKKLLGENDLQTAKTLFFLGQEFYRQNRKEEAENAYRQAFETERELLGEDHPISLATLLHLGRVLADSGRLAEAENLQREVLRKLIFLRKRGWGFRGFC